MPVGSTSSATDKRETMAEMAASLLALEGEKIEVVHDAEAGKKTIMSDAELDVLLDRSDEVFKRRGAGWNSAKDVDSKAMAKGQKVAHGKEGMFEVYEAPKDEGNEALARMMGEDEPNDED